MWNLRGRTVVLAVALISCSNAFSTRSSISMKSLVVISPPGGVGEVAAVKAATMGSSVRWFVVSSASNENAKVALSSFTLEAIAASGGKVELAGADANSILNDASALDAISTWCSSADGLVCTLDGVQLAVRGKEDEEDPKVVWTNALKLAAQQAGKSIQGVKLAIIPTDDEEDNAPQEGIDINIFASILGKNKLSIPSSLAEAMSPDGKVVMLRHGELFGVPESSPKFSALMGGPRKDAVLCEEYQMRTVRLDPSLSLWGNSGVGVRSSRHAVGEAAALLALNQLTYPSNLDVCVSSQRGVDPVSLEVWEQELERVDTMLKSGQGALLFSAAFAGVPDVERLADWLATKWAPAIFRTYDIAAIRIGARPVYASRTGEGQVEIVWQQLDNFESVTAGKLLIQVSKDGIVATRGPGDASKGYGSISRKPLPGENVLVTRLADAASQAIEKGLANKPVASKKPKPQKKKVEPIVPVTSVKSSGTVMEAESRETGPRQAGARRSSERARGTRVRKASPSGDDGDNDNSNNDGDNNESFQ